MEHQAARGLGLFRVEQRLKRREGVSLQARGFYQLLDRLAKLRIRTHDRHQTDCKATRINTIQRHYPIGTVDVQTDYVDKL